MGDQMTGVSNTLACPQDQLNGIVIPVRKRFAEYVTNPFTDQLDSIR